MNLALPLLLLLLLSGCPEVDSPSSGASAPPPRAVGVAAAPKKEVSVADFCEVRPDPKTSAAFTLPDLDGAPPPKSPGWGWVNVWATWCAPCIEEMPRLAKWEGKLKADLGPGALQFLSVDAEAKDLRAFYKKHPDAPKGLRIKDFALLEPWLKSVGLDAGAVLPIHLFLDEQQRVSCIRMGPVTDEDYGLVKRVLGGG